MQRVVFRADGNSKIGLGHVYRSLALAEMLKDNFNLVFIIREPLEELKKIILQTCDQCIELGTGSKRLSQEITLVTELLDENDIVVLDGYHFDGEYQKKIRACCHKLISIDDMHEGHFYSDYILNHCGSLNPNIYDKEPYTKLLLGPQYALLRPPFLRAAQKKHCKKKVEKPYSVFLCMGGSDHQNITSKAIKSLDQISKVETLNIVLGAANQHKSRIYELTERDERCKIFNNLSGQAMCDLMTESNIAITPGSSISFEVCAVGLGLISGYYTDNQHDIINWLDKAKCASIVGDFRNIDENQLRNHITAFLDSNTITSNVKNQQIIDGYSGERLLKFFEHL